MLPQLAGLGLGFVSFDINFQFDGLCSVVEVDGVGSDAEVGDGLSPWLGQGASARVDLRRVMDASVFAASGE